MGCDIHAMIERKSEYSWWINSGDPGLSRDYELFAVLAGVRNDNDIKPISEPRGLPERVTDVFESWSSKWDSDGHSHSYVTLEELKAFDPNQEIDDKDLVLSRDEQGNITGTCGWANHPTLGPVGKRKVFGVWGDGHFSGLIAEMESVKSRYKIASDEHVRLVFFFDN